MSAWNDEDDMAQSPGDFERWTRIDRIFCRTTQLFDEATAEGNFFMTNPGANLVFDEEKVITWLRKLSVALPLFVTRHRTHIRLLLLRVL